MDLTITNQRTGGIPALPSLGYLLLFYYLAFFAEAAYFLTPGQIANEYSACQRLSESGWLLVVSIVLIFQRRTGDTLSRLALRSLPFVGYLGLLFCFIYLFVPVVAWNASNRLNGSDLQQAIASRETAERQLQGIVGRLQSLHSMAELSAVPNLMKLVPDSVDHSDFDKVKAALMARMSEQQTNLQKQSAQELNNRQTVRQIQTFRLFAQCILVSLGCIWVWTKTRKLVFDVDFG